MRRRRTTYFTVVAAIGLTGALLWPTAAYAAPRCFGKAATIVGTMCCMPADARTKPQKRYEVQRPPAPDARRSLTPSLDGRRLSMATPEVHRDVWLATLEPAR